MPTGPIFVPFDDEAGGRRAVGTARDLATGLKRSLLLFSVAETADVASREALAASLCPTSGVPCEVEISVSDDVGGAIVEAAERASLVCMATAASLLPHHGHFGSIAEEVVRRVDRPVVLVGPHADPDLRRELSRVIVPVDGSKLSEAALGPAAGLAEVLDVPVWVVTVVEDKAAQQAAAAGASESGYVAALARDIARIHGVSAEFEVLHISDPADAILDFAQPDGIVVMTTHGRTGLARLFAGSVTTSVVARATHPVLVLHPGDEHLSAG